MLAQVLVVALRTHSNERVIDQGVDSYVGGVNDSEGRETAIDTPLSLKSLQVSLAASTYGFPYSAGKTTSTAERKRARPS